MYYIYSSARFVFTIWQLYVEQHNDIIDDIFNCVTTSRISLSRMRQTVIVPSRVSNHQSSNANTRPQNYTIAHFANEQFAHFTMFDAIHKPKMRVRNWNISRYISRDFFLDSSLLTSGYRLYTWSNSDIQQTI